MAFRDCIGALAFGLPACAAPQGATLSQFEAALATQDSATAALIRWCDARGIADPADVRALPVAGERSAVPPKIRELLQAAPEEALGYRHVRLTCGDIVLSEAHNWYVPGRLTPEMNSTLEASNMPFGRVVAPLGFTRKRLGSIRGATPGCPEGTVLSHRAVLKLPDGKPISALIECYTAANLAEN